MDDLTPEELEILRRLAKRKVLPICPSCGYREQDPKSKNGFCQRCDDQLERVREAKREWWRRNRGKS